MHSAASSAVLALLQHFPCIGAGKLGNVVAGDEARQGLYTAIFIQRMDLGIGALVGHIFLDEQMTISQCCNLRRISVEFCFLNFRLSSKVGSCEALSRLLKTFFFSELIYLVTRCLKMLL